MATMAPDTTNTTHYDVLGLPATATAEEIKARFREMARTHHPDVATAPDAAERFKTINEAYRILSDPERRAAYDAELKLARLKRERKAAAPPQPPRTAPRPRPRPRPQGAAGPQTAGRDRGPASGPPPRQAETNAPGAPRRNAPHEASAGTEIDRLILQAQLNYRRMKFREAERICKQVLRTERRNAIAYEIIGDVNRARGDYEQALAMYSYALQLDRTNTGLRDKVERLAAKNAEIATAPPARSRYARRRRSHAGAPARVLVNALGLGLIVVLAALTTQQNERNIGMNPLTWDGFQVFAMALSGFAAGVVLAINGSLGMLREELAFETAGRTRGLTVPFGLVVVGCSAISFYAAFLLYMVTAFKQEMVSQPIVRSFGFTFVLVALFTLCRSNSMDTVLVLSGNIIHLTFIAGWAAADGLRRA